ncbi:5-HT1 receptor [Penaeus vannamei]|uniref:5-HT1 receptor n=1 Tax=Penaeus vannamei TaxID=6689 RepID=A0A3R7PDZ6_PENVA|nr:5-HT1 receptor [Penaeus vannamei]
MSPSPSVAKQPSGLSLRRRGPGNSRNPLTRPSFATLTRPSFARYWAVTQVDYIHSRNGTRIGTMILLVWLTAVVVSIAPLFGWKDPDFLVRVNQHKKCLVSQDVGYQIFATMATFYVPLTAILILYWKIFQAARKRIHKNRPGEKKEAKKKGNNNRAKAIEARICNMDRGNSCVAAALEYRAAVATVAC